MVPMIEPAPPRFSIHDGLSNVLLTRFATIRATDSGAAAAA